MKIFLILFTIISFTALAQDMPLNDFDWTLTDVAQKGLSKERLYSSMSKGGVVRIKDSICSNRAQVWAYDFKRSFSVNTAKVFLFFTPSTSWSEGQSWWYHVAPAINENGKLWVMDAGYPDDISNPIDMTEWLEVMIESKDVRCKEIRRSEKDLIALMYEASAFPEVTKYGNHNCYYMVVPEGYWTPNQLAQNLLEKDEDGNAINFSRGEALYDEAYQACLETSTTAFGYAMGGGKGICSSYLN